MREILFRGKRLDNGEWVEGYLLKTRGGTYIMEPNWWDDDLFISPKNIIHAVDPATVGQFTGLPDKNGKRIFEGDIVEDGWVKGVVKFLEGTFDSGIYRYNGWVVEYQGYVDHRALSDAGEEWEKPVVFGNIYDNPELLEVNENE